MLFSIINSASEIEIIFQGNISGEEASTGSVGAINDTTKAEYIGSHDSEHIISKGRGENTRPIVLMMNEEKNAEAMKSNNIILSSDDGKNGESKGEETMPNMMKKRDDKEVITDIIHNKLQDERKLETYIGNIIAIAVYMCTVQY